MKTDLHLTTEQRLQQRLAPMQVQYVKMLEMNAAEVDEVVRRALDENPALERSPESASPASETGDRAETAYDMARADYGSDDDTPPYLLEARNSSPDDFDPSEAYPVADSDTSLADVLTAQLADYHLSEGQEAMARYIIGNIDDNGYLTRTLREMADDYAIYSSLDITPADMRPVYDLVRSLDPPGVGAMDLRDCILLQLRRRDDGRQDVADAIAIIDHYYDLFSKKHFDRIASALSLSPERMKPAIDAIRALNPKPGALVGSSRQADAAQRISPDFQVDVDADGRISVALASTPPELMIAESFDIDRLPEANERTRQAMAFIKQRHDEAAQLIRLLEMRRSTLLRVMAAIARLQRDFFLTDDPSRIRHMVLRDVSDSLGGMDLSVISRATSGKYVMTRSGVYPLKMLFNERPLDDSDASFHSIAAELRAIIEAEDKRHPLSDEEIRERLSEKGTDIARRTVSKYRERLGFPVARLRREL